MMHGVGVVRKKVVGSMLSLLEQFGAELKLSELSAGGPVEC